MKPLLPLLLFLCSPAHAQIIRAVMEGTDTSNYTLFVDTANARLDVSTDVYNGVVPSLGLFTSSNVSVEDNVILYSSGSIVANGTVTAGTITAANFSGPFNAPASTITAESAILSGAGANTYSLTTSSGINVVAGAVNAVTSTGTFAMLSQKNQLSCSNGLTTDASGNINGCASAASGLTAGSSPTLSGEWSANNSSYTIVSNSRVYSPGAIGFGWQNYQSFTVNGSSWCVPTTVTRVMAWITGGGGGGANNGGASVESQGGGGGCTDILISTVTPGSCYPVHIGSGGTGSAYSSSSSGGNGGASTFLGESAGGGTGGAYSPNVTTATGAGGTCSGMGLFFNGQNGAGGFGATAISDGSESGGTAGGIGNSGAGSASQVGSAGGNAPTNSGGGGASGLTANGGDGAAGRVIIWW